MARKPKTSTLAEDMQKVAELGSASIGSKVHLKVSVDRTLANRLEPLLLERKLTLDQAISLFLRGMVNTSDRARALRLCDPMPFGKYQGETIETILRAQPGYIEFINATGNTRFDPEVLRLLEELTEKTK